MQQPWHIQTAEEVYASLETSEAGLTLDEVRARQRQYGPNALPEPETVSPVRVLLRQFVEPLMLVLIAAAIASVLVGEAKDAIVILAAVLMNACVGFLQEWKAERAAEALKSYEIRYASVRRGDAVMQIPATELVPGDRVLLEAGARVPADVRLVTAVNVDIDEAILTGESHPVQKQTAALEGRVALAERVNMAFMGTTMLAGRAEGVVVATGSDSRLGSIARLVHETEDERTPLQVQMQRFGRILGVFILLIAAGLFVIGLLVGETVQEMLTISIALAVAAIPEGLLIALTVVLALGMQRMLKRKALVRRLVAAETLGSVSVICTDKTGTLTEGRMRVVEVATQKSQGPMKKQVPDDVYDLLVMVSLNNDAAYGPDGAVVGHPTEAALLEAAASYVDVDEKRDRFARVDEVPFSSDLKYMVTVHEGPDRHRLIVKGAPERVLQMCAGKGFDAKEVEETARAMVQRGLRVLAVAYKDNAHASAQLEGLTYAGLVGIEDPLRDTVKGTVKQLRAAGIELVVITGDHPQTAKAIAKEAGLSIPDGGVLTGVELDELSDIELAQRIREVRVFARVDPRHKVRIVQAWKACGEVVAMVGDGVNDAPALKTAAIGVSVGSGTDVTQQTSDMVLLDNDISTIAAAVREGRVIFDNIRKVIVYLMSDSFTQMVLIAGALLLGLPLPIVAVQILWINIVSDGFPYMALTLEPGEPDVMERVPRRRDEPVLNGEMKWLIFAVGLLTDVAFLGLFIWLLSIGSYELEYLRTMIFTALAIASLFYAFAVRSLRTSVLSMNPFGNRWLIFACILGILIQLMVVYAPPFQTLFGTVSIRPIDWALIVALAVVKLVAIELAKIVARHYPLKKQHVA